MKKGREKSSSNPPGKVIVKADILLKLLNQKKKEKEEGLPKALKKNSGEKGGSLFRPPPSFLIQENPIKQIFKPQPLVLGCKKILG
jgi:hypothetical protein